MNGNTSCYHVIRVSASSTKEAGRHLLNWDIGLQFCSKLGCSSGVEIVNASGANIRFLGSTSMGQHGGLTEISWLAPLLNWDVGLQFCNKLGCSSGVEVVNASGAYIDLEESEDF